MNIRQNEKRPTKVDRFQASLWINTPRFFSSLHLNDAGNVRCFDLQRYLENLGCVMEAPLYILITSHFVHVKII